MVSTHSLCHSWTFSIEIQNIDASKEYTGQVLVQLFWQRYAPWTYGSWSQNIFYESHILSLLLPRGHSCHFDIFLALNMYDSVGKWSPR